MWLLFFHAVIYGGFAWGASVPTWISVGLAMILIWISVVDIERFEIPDAASAVLFITGGAYVLLWPGILILDHVLGAMIWPSLFWLVGVVYLCWRGVHGLGFGDVKLMAGIALWVGFQGAVLVVLAASLAGIAVLLVYMMVQRGKMVEIGKSAVAFGPFLCLSAWAVWLQGVFQ